MAAGDNYKILSIQPNGTMSIQFTLVPEGSATFVLSGLPLDSLTSLTTRLRQMIVDWRAGKAAEAAKNNPVVDATITAAQAGATVVPVP